MSYKASGKEKKGILIFCNRKYMFALGTFLINLQKYVVYDGVIVYHEGFSEIEQEAIRKVESRVKFIEYGLENFAEEFGFDEEKLKSYFFIQRYSVLAVIKFKIFQHLDEFSTIILFDLDMILLDSMDDLLEKPFDIAWRMDGTILNKLRWWNVSDEVFRKIGMQEIYKKIPTPNAGFIVVKRLFDYKNVYKECVEYLQNYSFLHPHAIDEVIYGYVCYKFNLNVYNVDEKVYNVTVNRIDMKSKLIHCMGEGYKPWKNKTVQFVFREWWMNYKKYVELTGMPSNEVQSYNNISEYILQNCYREMWKDLFYKYNFVYPHTLRMKPEFDMSKISFSYNGVADYEIETGWIKTECFCYFKLAKENESTPVEYFQKQLREIALKNGDFISYQENENWLGLKTVAKFIWDIPDMFYRLYDMTEEVCKKTVYSYAKISTYHGTKLYVNLQTNSVTHDTDSKNSEVYACLNGGGVALLINKSGMNVYINDIESGGKVVMSGKQTFFSCIHNNDRGISIEIKDGSILSAEKNGKLSLRHWNREWEHFYVQRIGTVME